MKKLQVRIEDELDLALEKKVREEGTSKSAVVRNLVRDRLEPLPPLESDPLWEMVGVDDYEPESVDNIVYR